MFEWLAPVTELVKAAAVLVDSVSNAVVRVSLLAVVPNNNSERESAARGVAAAEAADAAQQLATEAARQQVNVLAGIAATWNRLPMVRPVALCKDCVSCTDGGCSAIAAVERLGTQAQEGHRVTAALLHRCGKETNASKCEAFIGKGG